LEDLLKQGRATLEFPFDPETELNLMKRLHVPLRTTRHVSGASVSGILHAVRNMVLEWCLQLEKDGILGEGLVFSAKEKEAAAHANYTINYNAPVAHSQIQQGSPHATQSMSVSETDKKAIAEFVGTLKGHAAELRLDASAAVKLNTEVQEIETQVASPNPSRTMLEESLRTIRNVLELESGVKT
jgi:hypothetical protein